jgi:hypothetical protein
MTSVQDVRAAAVRAAQRRLVRALQFVELNARKPLFEKTMRLEGGRRVRVGLYMPGPVLVQFDPDTAEVLARSKPGQLNQLDESFLQE